MDAVHPCHKLIGYNSQEEEQYINVFRVTWCGISFKIVFQFQFIYGRLEILNSGAGFRDIFEVQATLYTDKLNSQSKYKEWLKSVKVCFCHIFTI